MNVRSVLSFAAGIAFLAALGLGPAPEASAQVIPGPCPSCDEHNARPGQGPGIWTTSHMCDAATGQGILRVVLGNRTNRPVPFTLTGETANGVTEVHSGSIPAAANGQPGLVSVIFHDMDMDQRITLGRVIDGQNRGPATFLCPCPPPPSTTTPPSSSSSVPGTTTPPVSSVPGTPTATANTLPATGGDLSGPIVPAGIALLAVGIIVAAITRRRTDTEAN